MEGARLSKKRPAEEAVSKSGLISVAPTKSKKRKTDSSDSSTDLPTAASSADTRVIKKAVKKTSRAKVNPLRPKAGSWLPHIASSVVHQCILQAMDKSIDPREHMEHINFEAWAQELLSEDLLKVIWIYISREYPTSTPLMDIKEELQPYSKLTYTDIKKNEIKLKYKGIMPKAPFSPFILFSLSKSSKLKSKYPSMSQPEIATKIGQKWKSLSPDQQKKYQMRYAQLKQLHASDMERFYEEHPDARLLLTAPKKKKGTKKAPSSLAATSVSASTTAELQKIKQLKAMAPKPPHSAYLIFCNKKRGKVHARHPELSPTEVTIKLGKKWKSLGEKNRSKYQHYYEERQVEYKQKLDEFYQLHPEAKEMLKRKPRTKSPKSTTTTTTKMFSSLQPDQQPNGIQQNGMKGEDYEEEVDEEEEDAEEEEVEEEEVEEEEEENEERKEQGDNEEEDDEEEEEEEEDVEKEELSPPNGTTRTAVGVLVQQNDEDTSDSSSDDSD